MAILQALNGASPGRRYPLDRAKSVLGRSADCDIVLDAGAVSRFHAQILRVGKGYFVEDLKSRNGTFLNGERITERQALRNRDDLKICDLHFAFRTSGVDAETIEALVELLQ